jgi:hypothetical protein
MPQVSHAQMPQVSPAKLPDEFTLKFPDAPPGMSDSLKQFLLQEFYGCSAAEIGQMVRNAHGKKLD